MTASPDSEPPKATLFYRFCAVLVHCVGTGYFQWTILHQERIPLTGPVIFAANHVSFGDPPLIGGAIPRPINYLARESLFQPPWFAKLIRSLNAIPLDRDGGGPAGMRTVLTLLAEGRAILLFPEGTRSADGRLGGAKSGTGLTVIRSGAPVIPVRIFGLHEIWGRKRLLPKPGRIIIKFGKPLRFDAERREAEAASRPRVKAIYEEVTQQVMDGIDQLQPCRDITTFG